ncbi:MAG: hypothetical protein SX243_24420 [Acidobacteriota bacterium]|nr:hypothetical protein [Acidobacteriota bacterium]
MPRIPYLYHSFQRRNAGSDRSRSVQVLKSILTHGLLITPEIVDWRTSGGQGFQVAQKRLCLTSLEEGELATHARLFGPITLGFRRSLMEEIGAVPVFYVPRSLGAGRKKRNLGGFQLERLYQTLHVVSHARQAGSEVDFGGRPVNLQDIESFIRYLTTQFYPIEDVEGDRDRFYLAQKEWRVQGNLIYEGEPLSRRLTDVEAEHVHSLDAEFFDRNQQFPTGTYRRIEQCMLMPSIGKQPVGAAIARVVAPSDLLGEVMSIFQTLDLTPEFVGLE